MKRRRKGKCFSYRDAAGHLGFRLTNAELVREMPPHWQIPVRYTAGKNPGRALRGFGRVSLLLSPVGQKTDLEVRMKSSLFAAAVALSLGLSFVVTIFPARRAARMNPVEALRYE